MTEEAVLARASLLAEIERLSPHDNEAGRRAEILVKHDQLRVTLVTMRSGIELDEHSTSVPITIHVLQGRFDVTFQGGSSTLQAGEFIALREHVAHSLRAIEDGAFLLTLGWDS